MTHATELEERLRGEEERLAGLERDLAERARAVDLREIEVAAHDERRSELEEREKALGAAAEEAAERERQLEQREARLNEREQSLGTKQSEVEQRERKLRRKRGPFGRTAEDPETDPEYHETALSARERDLEKRAAAVEGVEDRIAEREAALQERETRLTEIERTLTRLQADVEQEQQAAAETLRTIEAREQELADAETRTIEGASHRHRARWPSWSARRRPRNRRVRTRPSGCASRRRISPPGSARSPRSRPSWLAARSRRRCRAGSWPGLDALASASHERRTRRRGR